MKYIAMQGNVDVLIPLNAEIEMRKVYHQYVFKTKVENAAYKEAVSSYWNEEEELIGTSDDPLESNHLELQRLQLQMNQSNDYITNEQNSYYDTIMELQKTATHPYTIKVGDTQIGYYNFIAQADTAMKVVRDLIRSNDISMDFMPVDLKREGE